MEQGRSEAGLVELDEEPTSLHRWGLSDSRCGNFQERHFLSAFCYGPRADFLLRRLSDYLWYLNT